MTGRWSGNKDEPHATLEEVLQNVVFERTQNPFPAEPSYYSNSVFHQGASITPNVLTMVESVEYYN